MLQSAPVMCTIVSRTAGALRAPVVALAMVVLAACSSAPSPRIAQPAEPSPAVPAPVPASPSAPAPTPSSKYYSDDGPPLAAPADLDSVPDAVPRAEPLHRFANRPYAVLGRDYVPATTLKPYRERGIASWYGRKFHGQKTSTGEVYDMFAMTAAHPTLALPSYARVTNAATGRSVVVRINDRGPFLHGRVIDLSYAAAHRLGIAQKGSGEVIVEAILPAELGVVPAPLPPVTTTASAVTEAPPIVAVAPPGPGTGFVVQLGAFASFANAQEFLLRVQNQTQAAAVEPRVHERGGLYRVVVGPYPDREQAKQVADRVASAFGLATAVVAH